MPPRIAESVSLPHGCVAPARRLGRKPLLQLRVQLPITTRPLRSLMKCILVFFLGAAAVFADDFTTGQAARLVIGQETFTSQDAASSDTVLGGVSGIAYAGDTLFVADSNRVSSSPNNHRVLLFKNLSSQLPVPTATLDYTRKCPVCLGQATVVLGQPDMTTTTESVPATQ